MPPNQREAKIPNTIDRAFYYCSGLTDIQFKGTVKEWQDFEGGFNSYWDFDTGNYTVTCTDGTITKGGTVTYFEEQ